MKIQIEGQQLRFRIDEAELAELLAGAHGRQREPVAERAGVRDWCDTA